MQGIFKNIFFIGRFVKNFTKCDAENDLKYWKTV